MIFVSDIRSLYLYRLGTVYVGLRNKVVVTDRDAPRLVHDLDDGSRDSRFKVRLGCLGVPFSIVGKSLIL